MWRRRAAVRIADALVHDESLLAAATALSGGPTEPSSAGRITDRRGQRRGQRRTQRPTQPLPGPRRDLAGWNEVLQQQATRVDLPSASSAVYELLILAKRSRLPHTEASIFHADSLSALGAALGSSPAAGRAIGHQMRAVLPQAASRRSATVARTVADVVDLCAGARDHAAALRWHRAVMRNRGQLNERVVAATANAMLRVLTTRDDGGVEALDFMSGMVRQRVAPHRPHVTRMIAAQVRRAKLHDALHVLAVAQRVDPYFPTQVFFNVVLRVAGELGPHPHTLAILDQMDRVGAPPDVVSYSTAINFAAKWADSETALNLLRSMQLSGVAPNVYTYSSVIAACAAARQPLEAVRVFRSMSRHAVHPNLICYSSLLNALARAPPSPRGDSAQNAAFAQLTHQIWSECQDSGDFAEGADAMLFNSALAATARFQGPEAMLGVWRLLVAHTTARPEQRSYTLALSSLADAERREEAVAVVGHMTQAQVKPDARLAKLVEEVVM